MRAPIIRNAWPLYQAPGTVLCREAQPLISPGLAADRVSEKRGILDGPMATVQTFKLSPRRLLWPPLCQEAFSAPGWDTSLGYHDSGVPKDFVVIEDYKHSFSPHSKVTSDSRKRVSRQVFIMQ